MPQDVKQVLKNKLQQHVNNIENGKTTDYDYFPALMHLLLEELENSRKLNDTMQQEIQQSIKMGIFEMQQSMKMEFFENSRKLSDIIQQDMQKQQKLMTQNKWLLICTLIFVLFSVVGNITLLFMMRL